MSASQKRDELASRLKAYSAVAFGVDHGCAHTAAMKRAWGPALGHDVGYVPCDAGPREADVCAKVGITTTPTLVFGGVQFPGFVPLSKVEELLDAADSVGAALAARSARLYVRPTCSWSTRQRTTLGPGVCGIDVVDCSTDEARCARDGVRAVPAWTFADAGGRRTPVVHGFQPLPGLQALLAADADGLATAAARTAAACRN